MFSEEEIEAIKLGLKKLYKDVLNSRVNKKLSLNRGDIRYLVDLYYQIQEYRKSAANQVRSSESDPCELVEWINLQTEFIEKKIKNELDDWTDNDPVSAWAKSIIGIGPVLSAGLAAHIDMNIATTVSKIWRFAGLDPTSKWEKNKKRPWNARLKVLCWKIGDSFVKVSGNEKSFYGKTYRERKEFEVAKSESGERAEIAKAALETNRRFSPEHKAIYKSGKLPPVQLDLRARRKAVKLFLSHWFDVAYKNHYKKDPPTPWAIEHGGHVDIIKVEDVMKYESSSQ